jgi:hypothetical protein
VCSLGSLRINKYSILTKTSGLVTSANEITAEVLIRSTGTKFVGIIHYYISLSTFLTCFAKINRNMLQKDCAIKQSHDDYFPI